MKDKTNTSVELTRAAVKQGKTVAIVGPTGFSIVDYVAGLSEEERNRLTVVEIEDYRLGDFEKAKARLREIIPTAFAVPHELLGLQRVDREAFAGELRAMAGPGFKPTLPPYLREGESCGHPGCLSHVSRPCEGCGRTGGVTK